MRKYYAKELPVTVYVTYGTRHCGKTYREFEKSPITFKKTKTKGVFNNSKPIDITLEELQAINKQIEELRWNK